MQVRTPDVFALKNSGFDEFLYADVGAELNGSALTVLSMISRLGRDPWAEAARWAALPRAGAVESLAEGISQMPLAPSALAETHTTAERLVQLLPATVPSGWQRNAAKAKGPSVPEWWVPITMFYCAMAFGMALSAVLTPKPSQAVTAPAEQQVGAPGAAGAGAAPPVHGVFAGSAAARSGQ